MRRVALLALVFATGIILSCDSDVPTAPHPASVTVSGRITDRDGPPLAGVYVYFYGNGGSYGVTDSDGRYSLTVTEGVYRVVLGHSIPRGYPYVELQGVVVGKSGATLDYHYEGVRISGSVTGPSGELLTSGQVSAYRTSGGPYVAAMSAAAAGHYSLLLPSGAYAFSAYSGGYEDGVPRITWNVSVASDTTIDIALAGFAILATTTLSGGTPMPGAGVTASNNSAQASAQTGLGGTATLYLPAGNYTIRTTPFPRSIVGPQTITRSITADDGIHFDFSGPKWSMTLRRASDAALLVGAQASLNDGEDGSAQTQTDAFGRCEFSVRPGIGYSLAVLWFDGTGYRSGSVSNLFSAADTTFDISVSDPNAP